MSDENELTNASSRDNKTMDGPFKNVCKVLQGPISSARALHATSPRELWLVFVIKFLESFAYFSTSVNMVLFFSNEHGLSDQQAGWLYGFYGVLTSVYGLLCGGIIDYLGVRKSLIIGGLVSATGRLLFAVGSSKFVLYTTTLFLMPLGMAFGLPVLVIGIKRYTNIRYRTAGFGLFYVMVRVDRDKRLCCSDR